MKQFRHLLLMSFLATSAIVGASSFQVGTIEDPIGGEESVKCRYTNVASDYCDDGHGTSRYYCVNTTADQTCKFIR